MRVAALDFGSNTFLLLVAEVVEGRIVKVYADETETVRLAQGIDKDKRFHPEALQRAEVCLQRYHQIIEEHQPEQIAAVATSAARDAQNKEQFIGLCHRYEIPLYIIDGMTEARLTYSGALFDQSSEQKYLVVDVGGGSTEIIGLDKEGLIRGQSVNVGSVRLTERLLPHAPASYEDLAKLRRVINEEFSRVLAQLPDDRNAEVVAVAGTPVTLALLEKKTTFDDELVHGHYLSLEKISWWCDHLVRMSVSERRSLPGMPPSRADVLVAGTAILEGALRVLNKTSLKVSTKGVRYGVAMSLAKEKSFF